VYVIPKGDVHEEVESARRFCQEYVGPTHVSVHVTNTYPNAPAWAR
jgi:hypothetical protein